MKDLIDQMESTKKTRHKILLKPLKSHDREFYATNFDKASWNWSEDESQGKWFSPDDLDEQMKNLKANAWLRHYELVIIREHTDTREHTDPIIDWIAVNVELGIFE